MQRHPSSSVELIGACLLALTMVVGCGVKGLPPSPSASRLSSTSLQSATTPPPVSATSAAISPRGDLQGPFQVSRVVDGDTIHVETSQGDLKVRLIGIDTPETVDPNRPDGCFGTEASAEAKRLLDGTSVYLELDPSQGETDRFGRTLAFVWMTPLEMFNLYMLQGGFATEYTYDKPYAYQREFLAAQEQAQEARAGLWSPATCDGETGS